MKITAGRIELTPKLFTAERTKTRFLRCTVQFTSCITAAPRLRRTGIRATQPVISEAVMNNNDNFAKLLICHYVSR